MGRPQTLSQREIAEIAAVAAPAVDLLGNLRRTRPEDRRGTPGHDRCHRRSPRAATQHSYSRLPTVQTKLTSGTVDGGASCREWIDLFTSCRARCSPSV